jgi:hypothetical protein
MGKNEILTALVGAAIGYIGALFTTLSKLKTDLAFIKGQLSQLVKIHGDVSAVKENQAIISREYQKTRRDVDAAHVAIRDLKATHTKG